MFFSKNSKYYRIFAAIFVVALGARGAADESSGTWTGDVELRTNYYWETSTRVIAPEVRARIVSPEGVGVSADYLIDAITSASIAAGVIADIRFTEVRNQGTLGIDREFDLGEAQLRVGASGRMSHEPDYLASGVTLSSLLSLDQRSTEIGFNLTYIHDNVGSVIRGADRMAAGGGNLSNRGRVGQLEGVTMGLSWSQTLTPVMTLSLGYDLVHNWGFLQNPYRAVMVQGVLRPEVHPEERTRHALYGRLAYFIEPTGTSIHLLMRAYADDWEVMAVTPEIRAYQLIGEHAVLRLRYRYYQQTSSYFSPPTGGYEGDAQLVTADPKMSAFESHLLGAHFGLRLTFLGETFLDFLRDGDLNLTFEYLLQTSRFGNGVIAQAGLRVPF